MVTCVLCHHGSYGGVSYTPSVAVKERGGNNVVFRVVFPAVIQWPIAHGDMGKIQTVNAYIKWSQFYSTNGRF